MTEKIKIQEGDITISVAKQDVVSKKGEVFYNPKMSIARSISIALLNALHRDWQIALPMAGTGIRAARILKEVTEQQIEHIDINDINPHTKKYMSELCSLNALSKEVFTVHTKDANSFLQESTGFNYIDIDPFGSPNFVLDSALKVIGKNGILAITATDTSALAGTYPRACQRKYWATPLRGPLQHELGIRILARRVQLIGISKDKALYPVLSYHFEHYYRIYFLVKRGKEEATKLFKQLEDKAYYCNTCTQYYFSNTHTTCTRCAKQMQVAGPLYSGPLQDAQIISLIQKEVERRPNLYGKEVSDIITQAASDADVGIQGFYELHETSSGLGIPAQKQQHVITLLREKGFKANRSSFDNKGIITNAPLEVLRTILLEEHEKSNT